MVCVGPYTQEDKRLPQKYGIVGEHLCGVGLLVLNVL